MDPQNDAMFKRLLYKCFVSPFCIPLALKWAFFGIFGFNGSRAKMLWNPLSINIGRLLVN